MRLSKLLTGVILLLPVLSHAGKPPIIWQSVGADPYARLLPTGGLITGDGTVKTTAQLNTIGSGGGGDAFGPASSSDNAACRFDGLTGKILQNSSVLISDTGNITGVLGLDASTVTISGTALDLRAGLPTRFYQTDNAEFIGLSSPAAGVTSYSVTLPAIAPSTGQFLKATSATALEWATPSGTGDVVGPGSATDDALARFDSTTGKLIQNSTGILTDAGQLTISKLGVGQTTPKSILHVHDFTTAGTVAADAIILGKPHATADIGAYSVILGDGSRAPGIRAFAGGTNSQANGLESFAFGSGAQANGIQAVAFAAGTFANGTQSGAGGNGTVASADQTFIWGVGGNAGGIQSAAFGYFAEAMGTRSFACGDQSKAWGTASFACGRKVQTSTGAGVGSGSALGDDQDFITRNDTTRQFKLRFANGMKLVAGGGVDLTDGTIIADLLTGSATFSGSILPTADNAVDVGSSSFAYRSLYVDTSIVTSGATLGVAELDLLDGHDVALVDTNDAVSTAITGTGALNAGSITSGFGSISTGDPIDGSTLAATAGDIDATAGSVQINSAGKGLDIKEGTNARMGLSTLVGGTVTVSTTAVTANSRIFLTHQNNSGTPGFVTVSARTAATSFVITSSNGADASDIAWVILEPL